MSLSVPAKVGLVLLLVCYLLKLSTHDTIIIVSSHYIAHRLI